MWGLRAVASFVLALAFTACGGKKEHEQPKPEAPPVAASAEADARRVCGACHQPATNQAAKPTADNSDQLTATVRAPTFEELRKFPTGTIVVALEHGLMRDIGATLKPEQRVAIAEWLTGQKYDASAATTGWYCKPGTSDFAKDLTGPTWTGWGNNVELTRFQPAEVAKLKPEDVPRLKPKWTMALPDGRMGSTMTVAGSRLYFGDQAGKVRAVNLDTGCTYWAFDAGRWVRTGIDLLQVGDKTQACFAATQFPAEYFCLDAATGAKLWQTSLDSFAMSGVTTSATLYGDTFYVPLTVGRESHRGAADPKYECCQGRGALVALDPAGKMKWRTYMTDEPKPTTKSEAGTQLWGPSGASAWKAPMIDTVRKLAYVTTGQNSSLPATDSADALIAIDLATGKRVWSHQFTSDDVWNGGCTSKDASGAKASCNFVPKYGGVDVATPLLKTLANGKRLIVVADKLGRVFAFDADKDDTLVWEKQVSPGGAWGGIEWGMAADDQNVYVPIHDRFGFEGREHELGRITNAKLKPEAGGLVALRLTDGKEVWRATGPMDSCAGKPEQCSKAFSQAPTVIPGVVFATSLDGHVRAFASADGKLLWDFDTVAEFDTVNGRKAKGGGMDGPGSVIVVDGKVIVSSGYGAYFTMPGNLLLTFTVDGK